MLKSLRNTAKKQIEHSIRLAATLGAVAAAPGVKWSCCAAGREATNPIYATLCHAMLCYVQGGVAGQRQEHVYSSWNFTPRAPEARRGQKGLRNADFGPS